MKILLALLPLSSCTLISPDELYVGGSKGMISPTEGRFYEADTYAVEAGLTWYLAEPSSEPRRETLVLPAPEVKISPEPSQGAIGSAELLGAAGTLLSGLLGWRYRRQIKKAVTRKPRKGPAF